MTDEEEEVRVPEEPPDMPIQQANVASIIRVEEEEEEPETDSGKET